VRELFQAIRDWLDLPAVANWDEEPERDAELRDRVGHLVGLLEVLLTTGTVEDTAKAVRSAMTRDLPYTAETPAQTAERHAMLAAHLAGRGGLRLIDGITDRGRDRTADV
jgi:hypothetical protein